MILVDTSHCHAGFCARLAATREPLEATVVGALERGGSLAPGRLTAPAPYRIIALGGCETEALTRESFGAGLPIGARSPVPIVLTKFDYSHHFGRGRAIEPV